jgi:hypothetical protein
MLRMSCVRPRSFVSKEQSHAPPQKPLSRACAGDLRDRPEADPGGSGLSPGAGHTGGRCWPPCQRRLCDLPLYPLCPPHMGATLCQPGRVRSRGSSAFWPAAQRHVRTRTAPPPPRRSRPASARRALLPMELSRTGDRVGATHRGPAWARKWPRGLKKNARSSCRPTGQLTPTSADLSDASLDLAALAYRARRGEMILLYAEETVLWRFALPRAGWWRKAQR